MNKYDPKNPKCEIDPVLRCDSCQALIRSKDVQKYGCCKACGNKRVRTSMTFTVDEMQQMKDWKIDPEFLGLFEGVDDA